MSDKGLGSLLNTVVAALVLIASSAIVLSLAAILVSVAWECVETAFLR